MANFESMPAGDGYHDEENGELDPFFCHAYGKCGNDCLMFGCAFEEAEDMRNWGPDYPETDEV